MARCRDKHTFTDWEPKKYNPDFHTKGGDRYITMTEEELKEHEEDWLKRNKKDKYGNYFFTKVIWERKCTKCNKEGMHYLNPDERPDNTEKAKVKKSPNTKVEREEKHGRKMSGYKEEKMSKGSQPW